MGEQIILTEPVLARLDNKGKLLVHVVLSVGLLSHGAIPISKNRVQSTTVQEKNDAKEAKRCTRSTPFSPIKDRSASYFSCLI